MKNCLIGLGWIFAFAMVLPGEGAVLSSSPRLTVVTEVTRLRVLAPGNVEGVMHRPGEEAFAGETLPAGFHPDRLPETILSVCDNLPADDDPPPGDDSDDSQAVPFCLEHVLPLLEWRRLCPA